MELAVLPFVCHTGRPGDRTPSRSGYCTVVLPPDAFDRLQTNLALALGKSAYFPQSACRELPEFAAAVSFISKRPPGPIVVGNADTSFLQLLYSLRAGKACVDLHYPYG